MPGGSIVMFGLIVLLSACTAPYYDPLPPEDAVLEVTRFDSPLSMEDSYRRLYARLSECVSSFYLVQPRFDHDPPKATVMVVQGLGFNRLSVLVNSFKARFDVTLAEFGSRVEVTNTDESLRTLIAASRDWLGRNAQGCRAGE